MPTEPTDAVTTGMGAAVDTAGATAKAGIARKRALTRAIRASLDVMRQSIAPASMLSKTHFSYNRVRTFDFLPMHGPLLQTRLVADNAVDGNSGGSDAMDGNSSRGGRVGDKERVRERVWSSIEAAAGVRRAPGARGRIPNFAGAELAAERLAALPEWQNARVVKLNPDSPQLHVRARAIDDGKLVYVAVPKLSAAAPFLTLERRHLDVPALLASSVEGAARHGLPTRLEDMQPLDLIVSGTVAVNAAGARIGKGGGYADLELALLVELGLVTDATTIATTVHDLQFLSEALPETEHDFRVDVIATPTRLLRCPRSPRPRGIVWEHLDVAKVEAIPVLKARALARRANHSTST
jgi:5-formyltetrahydrofolate cyclo-ligase